MSDFIPKATDIKSRGLGRQAQKLQALREKAAKQSDKQNLVGASSSAAKPTSNFAGKKTAFQRKAV